MISVAAIKKAVSILNSIKFCSKDESDNATLMEYLGEMCETDEQVLWLARKVRNLYPEWPGAHELRAVLCSKYSPKDGFEVYSAVYLDGVPSERERAPLQIQGRPILALPEGHSASVDLGLESFITHTAEALKMPPLPKYYAKTEDERRVHAELLQMYHLGDGEVNTKPAR